MRYTDIYFIAGARRKMRTVSNMDFLYYAMYMLRKVSVLSGVWRTNRGRAARTTACVRQTNERHFWRPTCRVLNLFWDRAPSLDASEARPRSPCFRPTGYISKADPRRAATAEKPGFSRNSFGGDSLDFGSPLNRMPVPPVDVR